MRFPMRPCLPKIFTRARWQSYDEFMYKFRIIITAVGQGT